jgi:hypothetical protein
VPATLARASASSKVLPFMTSGLSQSMESGSFKDLKGASFFRFWRILKLREIDCCVSAADHWALDLEGFVWICGFPSSSLNSFESLALPDVRSILHSSNVHLDAPTSFSAMRFLGHRLSCPPWSLTEKSVSSENSSPSDDVESGAAVSSRRRLR